MQEDKIGETKRESWKKLSIAMAAIFNAAIK